MASLPTESLQIQDVERANEEILAFAQALVAKGQRPWFEVHYPNVGAMDDAEFRALDDATFDAVEVIDGEIVTLPAYAELVGGIRS